MHLRTSQVSPWVFPWKGCSRALSNLILICSFLFSLVLPASLLRARWENGVVVVVRIIALVEISELNEISPVSGGLNSEKVALGNDQAWTLAYSPDHYCLVLCLCFPIFLSVSVFSLVSCFIRKLFWSRTIFLGWVCTTSRRLGFMIKASIRNTIWIIRIIWITLENIVRLAIQYLTQILYLKIECHKQERCSN